MNYFNNNNQDKVGTFEEKKSERVYQYVYEEEKVSRLMNKVFLWMAAALGLTALTSYALAFTPIYFYIYSSSFMWWGLIIAELILVSYLSRKIFSMSFFKASICMAIYSVLNGITLSYIFAIFDIGSIVSTFLITAGTFFSMAVLGYFIKKDLSRISRFLMMILMGLIIATVVNLFIGSSQMDWIISLVGILLFTILTAVDTNVIKKQLTENNGAIDSEDLHKIALLGSLNLYLDFINLFIYLLRFLGVRD